VIFLGISLLSLGIMVLIVFLKGWPTVTLVTLFGGLISIFRNLGFELVPQSNLGFQALIKYFSNL
jgi:hypothetical protein